MESFKGKLIGFVIPAKDEAPTLRELYQGIAEQCSRLNLRFEVVFVDDGSEDNTWEIMQGLSDEFPANVRSVKLRSNVGKARALATGFQYTRGDIVFTMDADLQDDPMEIPRFLQRLDEGYDLVSGYKQKRYDPWHKVYPSRIFNKMLSTLSGVHLHDHNCGFKCYRAEVAKSIRLYGSMHRMVPVLASIEGFKVGEIVVQHHPRRFGSSKYGAKRFLNGFMDMLTVTFLKYFRESPLHVFGRVGILAFLIGVLLISVGFGMNMLHLHSLIFFALGACLVVSVMPLMAIGFTSELIISGKRGYRYDIPLALDTYNVRDALKEEKGEDKTLSFRPRLDPKSMVREVLNSQERPIRVLLVEDDAISRKMIRLMLKSSNIELIEAIDGLEGLEKIQPDTDIVLLDINMPKLDGIGFLNEVKKRNLKARVIVQTASSKVDFAIQAMKLGAFDYLTKPFTREQLLECVGKAQKLSELSSAFESLTQSTK